ncbi:MAG TPA: polyprenol monophosphomannose synthase [Pirellulaceae bacterium]|nr:polyprenol monophosphomannose synthase [Pirellulaceae bacterium]
MPESPRTLVITATYNEIENLPTLVDELFRHAPNVDLLVIDDNSPDGTGRWCDERAAVDPRVHCLHRSAKLGLGTAIVSGLQYAIDHDYDFVVNMDADLSHHPRHIPELLRAMQPEGGPPRDLVIGSRYVAGGRIENWPRRRRWMSRLVNAYARWLLRLPVKDCSGGYRCHRVSALRKIDFRSIRARGYAFLEELLWRLRRSGAELAEVPITFTDREHGRSKINLREALAALWFILRLGVWPSD